MSVEHPNTASSSPMSGAHTLDRLLVDCDHLDIRTEYRGCGIYRETWIVIEPFEFRVNKHDTGTDVRCWIVNGEDRYNIIRTTYWHRAGYSHNPSRWERGTWDNSLAKAIETLREEVSRAEEEASVRQEREAQSREQTAAARKAAFEAMFKDSTETS